jgi:hypothetical protein
MVSIYFYDAKLMIIFEITKYFLNFFLKNIYFPSKSDIYIGKNKGDS